MKDREVAESYAETHGLPFLPQETLPFRPPLFLGTERCVNAIHGTIANGPPGVICQRLTIRPPGLPAAQYEIAGLGDVLEGLWVQKSGRSIWTRVALPRRYTELMLPSDAFNAHYRVAIPSDRDEDAARRLLSGDFLAWLAELGSHGSRLLAAVGISFEIWQGVLFISGPIDTFRSTEKLDAFASASARIATEVAALANAPRG